MYTDDEKRSNLPLGTFIISFILVVVFVVLLMWLLPIKKENNEITYNGQDTLSSRVFNSNLQEMKNAAITYFNTEKISMNTGETYSLTLKEMNDLKLILPVKDEEGNICNTKDSYVDLTKQQEDYEMKVNLKCSSKEDYLTTKLGFYSYCESKLCEKNDSSFNDSTDTKEIQPVGSTREPVCSLYVSNGTLGKNNWYTTNATIRFKTKRAVSTGASIVEYGIGNSATASFNNRDSYTVIDDGINMVYGYVKDSNGKTAICSIVVKKDTEEPSCNLTILSGTKSANGNYISDVAVGFEYKNDSVSGIKNYGLGGSSSENYNSLSKYSVTKTGNNKVYGFVEDAAGHTSQCDMVVIREDSPSPVHTDSTPSCSLKLISGVAGENGWYRSNVAVGFASKTSTNGATITSYGIGTYETYQGNSSFTVNSDGLSNIYGYVKDSNGNTATCSISIKKDSMNPICSLRVIDGTLNQNGYYTSNVVIGFVLKADTISNIGAYGIGTNWNYNGNETYTVTNAGENIVYGFVKDNAGNIGSCSIKIEKGSALEYQYKKNIGNQYSDWSNWETLTYSPSNPPKFGKEKLIEIEDLGNTQVVDYYKESVGDAIYKYKQVKVGTVNQTYCTGYNYYRDTKNTTITYAIRQDSGWLYAGMVTTNGNPTDTLSVKYEFVGFDWKCADCEKKPRKIWNKYTRTVSYATSSNTITTNGVTTKCERTETRPVEIFDTVKIFVDYEIIKTPVYKNVYAYRQRTRSLLKKAYVDYKWSTYNDEKLLNDGYVYTGNTRTLN